MAVTSVDLVESKANHDAIESALQDWVDNTTFTTVHHAEQVYEHRDRTGVAIFYE